MSTTEVFPVFKITYDDEQSLEPPVIERGDSCVGTSCKTFGAAAKEYIKSKSNTLPLTLLMKYNRFLSSHLKRWELVPLDDISDEFIQKQINKLSAVLMPKTVHDVFEFISAVLYFNNPKRESIRITFPRKRKASKPLPTVEDVLTAVVGSGTELPALLALRFGLRLSEICKIRKDDIKNGILEIYDASGNCVECLNMPKYITRLIFQKDGELIVPEGPRCIYARFERLLKRSGLVPNVSFHDLRHINTALMRKFGNSNVSDSRIDDYFQSVIQRINFFGDN